MSHLFLHGFAQLKRELVFIQPDVLVGKDRVLGHGLFHPGLSGQAHGQAVLFQAVFRADQPPEHGATTLSVEDIAGGEILFGHRSHVGDEIT